MEVQGEDLASVRDPVATFATLQHLTPFNALINDIMVYLLSFLLISTQENEVKLLYKRKLEVIFVEPRQGLGTKPRNPDDQ